MTGEIEEPFTLDFRVDSFGSGSISFGRFENEALCWERRSSFLHNRYLEEVEKCSTPGSVIQKKAYFEAHFRKKVLPVLTSPEFPDDKYNQNETLEVICDDGDIDHKNASIHSAQFDQSSEHFLDDAELGTTLEINFESGIQTKENLDCEPAAYIPYDHVNEGVSSVPQQTSLPEKNSTTPKPEKIKPRLVPRVSPGPSRKNTPGTTSKGSVNKANDKVRDRDERVRSKAEKKTSEDPHKHRLLHKTTKSEGRSETKGVDKIKSGEREVRSRSRTSAEPQHSISTKVSGRAYQTANRVKPAVGVSKPGTRQDISKQASIKVAEPSNIQARKHSAASSIPGTRLSKSSQSQSGLDQTTSTSTAQTSKVKASQPGISRKKEPEKEKLSTLPQKTRIERSSYASFNRAGRVAVGVGS